MLGAMPEADIDKYGVSGRGEREGVRQPEAHQALEFADITRCVNMLTVPGSEAWRQGQGVL